MKKHPAFTTRHQAVKQAHQQLSKADPTFRTKPPAEQFKAVQQAVRQAGHK